MLSEKAMSSPTIIEPLSLIWWIGMSLLYCSFGIIQIAIRILSDKRKVLMMTMGFTLISIELMQEFYLNHLGLWSSKPLSNSSLWNIGNPCIMMLRSSHYGFEFLALIGSPGAYMHS